MKLTDEQREQMVKVLSVNWRNMHTNESLGYQRMLANSLVPLIESWFSSPDGYEVTDREEWKIHWDDGTTESVDSLEKARKLVKFWDYDGAILKRHVITYTTDWEEVEIYEPNE